MATAAPQTPIYGTNERNLMRLRCIHSTVPTRVFLFLLVNSIFDRPPNMSFLEYYIGKGISKTRFKSISAKQKNKLASDLTGESFDITLLYVCLRKGCYCHGLAEETDDRWKEGSDCLESLITSVKNKRNSLAHENFPCSNEQLLQEASELKSLLTKIIKLAKVHYGLAILLVEREVEYMDERINKYLNEEVTPLDIVEYQKQLFFPAQSILFCRKGTEEISMHYRKDEDSDMTFLTNLVNVKDFSNDFCSEMVLLSDTDTDHHKVINYQDIFEGEGQIKTDCAILIEGINGTGKTALLRALKKDWMSKNKPNMPKYLNHDDIFLYAECRNPTIRSFEGLLRHLMPKVARDFRGEDLKYIALDQQIFIALDGLEELTDSMTQFLGEVLQLKRDFGITLMATTTPERIKCFQRQAVANQIKIKHIRLTGIPFSQVPTFVTVCYNKIAKEHPNVQKVEGLLSYIQSTLHRLADIWRYPKKLVFLTILWARHHIDAHRIRSAQDLYREVQKLYRLELEDRLRLACPLYDSEIKRIIDMFLYILAKESLLGIKKNHINLTEEAYFRLNKEFQLVIGGCKCPKNSFKCMLVPIEKLTEVFLSKISMDTVVMYKYHFKDLQDWLAAYYLFTSIMQPRQHYDVQKIITGIYETLSQNAVPTSLSKDITTFTEEKLMTTSRGDTADQGIFHAEDAERAVDKLLNTFNAPVELIQQMCQLLRESRSGSPQNITTVNEKEVSGSTTTDGTIQITESQGQKSPPQMQNTSKIRNVLKDINGSDEIEEPKYQQTLIYLLGMLCAERNQMSDGLKLELLSLLQEAGVRDKQGWLDILNSMRYNSCVATFVSQQPGMLQGDLRITDSSVVAYTSLLKALNPPPVDASCMNISINLIYESSSLTKLIYEINRNEVPVSIMKLPFRFEKSLMEQRLEKAISSVFQRCDVERYQGPIAPGMTLPPTIKWLSASITNYDCYLPVRRFLKSNPRLQSLVLCLNPRMSSIGLSALQGHPKANIYLTGIRLDSDIDNASQIVRGLAPVGGGQLQRLYFPRAAINYHEIADLILNMTGINVDGSVVFPTKCRPQLLSEQQQLSDLANHHLNCSFGVEWGKSFGVDIDEW